MLRFFFSRIVNPFTIILGYDIFIALSSHVLTKSIAQS